MQKHGAHGGGVPKQKVLTPTTQHVAGWGCTRGNGHGMGQDGPSSEEFVTVEEGGFDRHVRRG